MKKVQVSLLFFLLSLLTLTAHSQQTTEWKGMEDFHAVMSTTFHPSEENNLQPLKEKAGDLLNKAKTWQKSEVPKGFNGPLIKPLMKRMVQEGKGNKEAVEKEKTEKEIKKVNSETHNKFYRKKGKIKKEKPRNKA